MPELLQRLHSGAACVLHHQETRIYHIGIAFAGDSFQVAYYDRAGCVLSGIYNVHEHPGTLVRTVMGLSYLDDSYLGKDTSVVLRDGREFTTVGGVEYEIVECLASDGDILGNGTTCWRCRRPDTDAQFVIKTKWTVVYPYRTSEAEFLKKAAGIDGVTTLICEDKVLRANGFPQDTMWLRDVLQGPERLSILRDHPRMELRRLVLRPYGRPLEDFASIDELLAGFNDAIKGARRILHCDISDNNVMLHDPDERDRSRGLLVDLDCAVFVRGADAVGPRGYGKGTHPFIACNVLNPDRYEARAPWHDLESFLYVLMYICATCSGPHDTPRENFDIDDSPMGPWLAGDYEHKTRVMFEYGDAEFRAFLGGLFDPYFDDLKDLVVDLRRVITRTSPSQGNYYDVYDVLEEHMEARAAARESASEDMASEEGSPPEGYSTDNSLASPSTSNHCVGSLTRNTSAGSSVGSKRKHTSRDEHGGEDDSVTRARLLQSSSSRGTDSSRGSLPFSDVSSDTLPSSVYLPSSVDERTSLASHSASQTFRVGDSALTPKEEKSKMRSHPTTEISQQPAVHPLKRRRVDCQLMVWL
ncbi:hypothetical protein K523DRAFT_304498 [Schizophyllum commune Tattone D]|nr:hypothetical protein K523DRAFT_304498 [Schizophyllum commune Tattone D]